MPAYATAINLGQLDDKMVSKYRSVVGIWGIWVVSTGEQPPGQYGRSDQRFLTNATWDLAE